MDNSITLGESLAVIEDKAGFLTGQAPHTPTYKISGTFQQNQEIEKSLQKRNKFMNECWNCKDRSHGLRDCPKPKNFAQISRSRKEFISSKGSRQVYKRYHLDESQQNEHLAPGKVSKKLARALGLEHRQLPSHIYLMRILGYPPGWLCEATVSHSGMSLFDGCSKEIEDPEAKYGNNLDDKYDIKKLVQYPGFNVPPPPGTYDDSDYWRVPRQSKCQSLEAMVERLQGRTVGGYKRKKQEMKREPLDPTTDSVSFSSQCEANNMDCEETPDDEELPQDNSKFILPDTEVLHFPPTPPDPERLSPKLDSTSQGFNSSQSLIAVEETSLLDLEEQKKQLLAELNDTTPLCYTPESRVGKVKSINLGTPIMQSISPFFLLPSADKFSVDICDVINFENLPNSTGKYKQMSSLIGKVRCKLSELNN